MGIYSNTGSSVYWNNPDSDFGLNNFGRNNGSLINCRLNNNIPMPLSTNYSAIGINGFGGLGYGGGIGLGGLGYGGGIGMGGIGIGMPPFMGNGFYY
jgi:hypothetical protein